MSYDVSVESIVELKLIGCAQVSQTIAVQTRFSLLDLVYDANKARHGSLSKIRIKEINIIDEYRYNYEDIFNRVWLEDELCTLDEANSLIAIAQNRDKQRLVAEIGRCNTTAF